LEAKAQGSAFFLWRGLAGFVLNVVGERLLLKLFFISPSMVVFLVEANH
jgi:hypothetical protein